MEDFFLNGGNSDFTLSAIMQERTNKYCMNFNLKNGLKTDQKYPNYTFDLEAKIGEGVKKVVIYHGGSNHIYGFRFYDKSNTLLCEAGGDFTNNPTEIVLEDDEVIMGFIAREYAASSAALYTDLQCPASM